MRISWKYGKSLKRMRGRFERCVRMSLSISFWIANMVVSAISIVVLSGLLLVYSVNFRQIKSTFSVGLVLFAVLFLVQNIAAIALYLSMAAANYELSVVGFGVTLVFFATTLMIGITAGTTALIARAIGAKDPKQADHFLLQSLLAGGILSVPLVVVGVLFAPQISAPFSPTAEVNALAAQFVSTIFVSMPALFVIFIANAALRAAGDTKTPLIIGGIENLMNFAINYTLIFGNFGFPALGVRGAAIGTAISYFTGAMLFLGLFADRRVRIGIHRERPLVARDTLRRVFRVGLPAATEQFAFQMGILIWIVMVVGFGEDAVA